MLTRVGVICALDKSAGALGIAARHLGVSRRTLQDFIEADEKLPRLLELIRATALHLLSDTESVAPLMRRLAFDRSQEGQRWIADMLRAKMGQPPLPHDETYH